MTWTQPGLYDAMGALGPRVTTEVPGPALPFDATIINETWSEGRLVVASHAEQGRINGMLAKFTATDTPGRLNLTLRTPEDLSQGTVLSFLRHFAYHTTGSESRAESWLENASRNATAYEEVHGGRLKDGRAVTARLVVQWAHVEATLRLETAASARPDYHGAMGAARIDLHGVVLDFQFPVRQLTDDDLTLRTDARGAVQVDKHYGERSEEEVQEDLRGRFAELGLPSPTFNGFHMTGAIC